MNLKPVIFLLGFMSLTTTVSATAINQSDGLSGKGTHDNPYLIKLNKHQLYNEQGQAFNKFNINLPHQAKHIYFIIHVPDELRNQLKSLAGLSVDIKDQNKMYGIYTGEDNTPSHYPHKGNVLKGVSNQCVGKSSGIKKGMPSLSQVCQIINNPKYNSHGGTEDPLFTGYYKMSISINKPLLSTTVDFTVALQKLDDQTNNFSQKSL